MITIIDYGVANIGSIQNMLRKIKCSFNLANNTEDILNASKIILPGVGSFDNGVKALKAKGFFEPLIEKANIGTPLLGICLGMQLLAEASEEGSLCGLGLIKGKVKKLNLKDSLCLKIPHMCWNRVSIKNSSELTSEIDSNSRFYFVHSYYFDCLDPSNILAETDYGISFASIVGKEKIFGTQFHPEKSHKYGIKIFSNFAKL